MDIKEAVIEALRSVVIPELDIIKEKISVVEARLDGIDKRFEDMRSDINQRFEDVNKRFEGMRADMNSRFEDMRSDMNSRFEDMRKDMNTRFDDHFNFNMKRFDSIESQINNILAEIRELRGLYQNKPDMEQFRSLENRYIELFREVTLLKQKVA